MDRIGPAGGTPLVELPNGQMGRQDENLGTGTEGTLDPALWSNALQEEIMYLLSQAGVTPDINNWTQVYQSLLTIIAAQAGGSAGGSIDGSTFYFRVPATGGFIIIQGGACSLTASQPSIQQLLPITFPNSFGGGTAGDGGQAAYQYAVAVGEDLSHAEIFCPLSQLQFGSIAARGSAAGWFIVWGS